MSYSFYYFITLVQRRELNLFHNPISGRYVAATYREHASDHEHRSPLSSSGYQPPSQLWIIRIYSIPLGTQEDHLARGGFCFAPSPPIEGQAAQTAVRVSLSAPEQMDFIFHKGFLY